MNDEIDRARGRYMFGWDPEGYETVRPAYPGWILDAIIGRVGRQGLPTLEIGAGTGAFTRQIIESGLLPLSIVEPDDRFTERLDPLIAREPDRISLVSEPFESIALPASSISLAVAATSFHWVDPVQGWKQLDKLLMSDGVVALCWNVFQVMGETDPFHEATRDLLAGLPASPSGSPGQLPYALDVNRRTEDASQVGFNRVDYLDSKWAIDYSSEQVVALYSGFSNLQSLGADHRKSVLSELKLIADEQFGGIVRRNITSCLYLISRT